MISVCIYGSVARRQTDELSDRDVLLLAPSEAAISYDLTAWRAAGWNTSFFTYSHFSRLVEFKSLFVQHIKVEGHVIRDDGGILQQLLTQFEPASSYRDDFKDALSPLKWTVLTRLSYWERLCVGDILFVATRNAGILHAASSGVYIFEYGAVVDYLSDTFGLNISQRSALFGLRRIKAAYRLRSEGAECSGVIEIAVEALKIVQLSTDKLTGDSSRNFIANNYHALRRKELSLVKIADPRLLDQLPEGDGLYDLWKLICNPSDYPKLRTFGNLLFPKSDSPSELGTLVS